MRGRDGSCTGAAAVWMESEPGSGSGAAGHQTALAAATWWFRLTLDTRAEHLGRSVWLRPGTRDYLYRSTKLVAEVAEKIIAKYYGRKSAHAYGRMLHRRTGVMLATQRYRAVRRRRCWRPRLQRCSRRHRRGMVL